MAAAVCGVIPQPVLGGVGIVLFGSVAASGIRTLSKVHYQGNHNMIVVGLALAFGLIPVISEGFWQMFPNWFTLLFDSGIGAATVAAVLLNQFFNSVVPSVNRKFIKIDPDA